MAEVCWVSREGIKVFMRRKTPSEGWTRMVIVLLERGLEVKIVALVDGLKLILISVRDSLSAVILAVRIEKKKRMTAGV